LGHMLNQEYIRLVKESTIEESENI
jgi:hypothetical protein